MGATATILGAYGAHKTYPQDKADELKTIYQTANRYHFFHTLALFGVPLSRYPNLVKIKSVVCVCRNVPLHFIVHYFQQKNKPFIFEIIFSYKSFIKRSFVKPVL